MRIFTRNPPPSTPANPATDSSPGSEALPPARVSILVVEDSPTQARVLQKLLEAQGYATEIARDGKEALDYLSELRADRATWTSFRPTLVISDIVMPHMEGTELCRHIKADEDFKDIPVILLTSLTDPREALRGLYNGADNLISKPYESSFLLARVEDLLATLQIGAGAPDKMFTITMDGRKYSVSPERLRIINSIYTVYETAINQTVRLEEANRAIVEQKEQLQDAQRLIEQLQSKAAR